MGLMVFGGLMTIPNLAVAAPAGKESVEIKKYDTLNAAAGNIKLWFKKNA